MGPSPKKISVQLLPCKRKCTSTLFLSLILSDKFFKNMVPDVSITMCESCCKCFLQDEYEFAYIEKGHCPFCKNVEKDKGVKNVYGSLADMR